MGTTPNFPLILDTGLNTMMGHLVFHLRPSQAPSTTQEEKIKRKEMKG